MTQWQRIVQNITKSLQAPNTETAFQSTSEMPAQPSERGQRAITQRQTLVRTIISALKRLVQFVNEFLKTIVQSVTNVLKEPETTFRPNLTMRLSIGTDTYEFLPHHSLPGELNKVLRERTTIYQVRRVSDKTLWALKVTNKDSRDRRIERTTNTLRQYQHMPGLFVTRRTCLTRAKHPELIAIYPELEYAVLMRWVAGQTWAGFMDDPQASTNYTSAQALELALATAHVLWNLEAHHMAHTDIAGDNVMVLGFNEVELIDIEGLFTDDTLRPKSWQEEIWAYIERILPMSRPLQLKKGSVGYQHPHLDDRGQCRPEGDRFAGAILLTEMLVWWNPLVRAMTDERYDSLFQAYEKEPSEVWERRLQVIRKTLWDISPGLQQLFDQAWHSSDLATCPNFATWANCLLQAQEKIMS